MEIDDLLRTMVEREASDLHIKAGSPPVLRVDGVLQPLDKHGFLPGDMERFLARLTAESQREALRRELELDFAYSLPGVARFRVNVFFQRGSLGMAIRTVPLQIASIDDLGLPEACKDLALRQRGLVLVTGPTGSGKSTTLAAMVDYLNEQDCRHVVTIEDPVEFLHRDKQCIIAQRELGSDTHSFSAALRHALRQDPDVILVGEMRDLDTIATALTAAETGHLVLSTLHTTSAAQTMDRIVDVFPPHQQQQIRMQLSLVLEGILCQALLPRLGGGRIAAVEVLLVTPAVRNLIREGKVFQIPTIIQLSGQAGMQTLDQALAALVRNGLVSPEEAAIRAASAEELTKLIGGVGAL
ncbi:MAG TPA: type IV pilus twitching motility protein PilT [Dehalococcoidia bacterium]|nr:type IV pilus twitching motility protein PilT [Dehalococcoidia bacterium]